MSNLDTPADALPLLAYKIAPRQFDVSYRFAHISLRDQLVRGQTLVRTLLETGLLEANAQEADDEFQLLICGAGAAGLAAAKEAATLGLSFVLIEKGDVAPGGVLRSTAKRYVSTAMYEWPHPNHNQHAYPLAVPELLGSETPPMPTLPLSLKKPVTVKTFGNAMNSLLNADVGTWQKTFDDYVAGKLIHKHQLFAKTTTINVDTKSALRAMLGSKVSIHGVPLNAATLPTIWLDRHGAPPLCLGFRFQYVIYAVGFATELNEYAQGKQPFAGYTQSKFWDPDAIPQHNLGFLTPPTVGILGSGDGALQDVLRCITKRSLPHALAVWECLMKCPQKGRRRLLHSPYVRTAMAEVAAADGYTTSGSVWSHSTHIFKSLDKAFIEIIDRLLEREGDKFERAVASVIRADVEKVTIVNRLGYFSRAYALNRFLVLLFNEVLARLGESFATKLEILSGEVIRFDQIGSNVRGAQLEVETHQGNMETRNCDLVIIRAGLDKNVSPTQLIGLTHNDTGRAELGRIPSAIRPIGKP
ncbi:MAG: hypothetical protein A3E01_00650 [Gammaproteobacteria bacterium RIFCSPHIGHO2_12_FULL_63_22]|nr:MAG: hypothetical protein A3E01_00650 [Gammaproteobacteria bacterium RIFCSPHIGHO2_12_FULL_63_22]